MAILVAAGCNVREVSEWAGHNSVAFTLSRYGGLFEDGSEAAVDRLDALLGGGAPGGGRRAVTRLPCAARPVGGRPGCVLDGASPPGSGSASDRVAAGQWRIDGGSPDGIEPALLP